MYFKNINHQIHKADLNLMKNHINILINNYLIFSLNRQIQGMIKTKQSYFLFLIQLKPSY